MKNAERYAAEIAHLIAEDPGAGTCTRFGAGINLYDGGLDCDTCPLNEICNNAEKLVEWLREEAPDETRT